MQNYALLVTHNKVLSSVMVANLTLLHVAGASFYASCDDMIWIAKGLSFVLTHRHWQLISS